MEFRILGPVEVVDHGKTLPLGGGRQLALFALLLLNANEVVSIDRLVDELWPEQPPATAGKIVRNYVSLLRKQLGDRLVHHSPGYLLRIEPGELDSERFETLVREARGQRPSEAAAGLRRALALWRGPALAELTYKDFAQRAIASLEGLRLQAVEDRIDADIELGRGRDVIPELERFVGEQPLRERPRRLLMLALYREGRQADALEAYRDARRTLVDELGLEPSPDLQELQTQILAHDPGLAGAARRPRASSRRRSGLLIIAGGVALLAAAIAAGVVELTGSSDAARLETIAANSIGVIDPKTSRIEAEIPLGTAAALSAGGDGVWAGDGTTVFRIDPEKLRIDQTITPTEPFGWPDPYAGAVWSLGQVNGSAVVKRLDPRHPHLIDVFPVGTESGGGDQLAVGEGAIWVSHAGPGVTPADRLTRIDPATGKVTGRAPMGAYGGLALGAGSVWLAQGAGTVTRLDAKTLSPVTTMTLGPTAAPVALSVGEHAVWVASRIGVRCPPGLAMPGAPPATQCQSPHFGTVSRIDPVSNAVTATIRVPGVPDAVLAAGGAVWVAESSAQRILRIDPRTTRVVARIPVGSRPFSLAAVAGKIWAATS